MMRLKFIIALLLVGGALSAQVRPWKKQTIPVSTPWFEDISPENVWPEYPRPQLERTEWMNLNGIWKLKQDTKGELTMPVDFSSYREILVPFPVESALSGVMLQRQRHVWYTRNFTIPDSWTGKRIMINFGAVDWESEVFINGQSVGVHRGGYDPFSYDITDKLKNTGEENEVVVRVYDPSDEGGQPNGKQWNNPFSVFYTACTGIWQTVWLEPVADIHVRDISMVPDIDASQLKLTVNVDNGTQQTKATVLIKEEERIIARQDVAMNEEVRIAIPDQKLWSPDSPFLYTLELSIEDNGRVTDHVKSYFGMRKVSMGEWGGYKRIFLNNEYLFNFGVLDQGYWPDGVYTAPCDEALVWDILKIKEMGFNTSRKHGKTEFARWYYHCDRLGLLVWQDMPSAPTGRDGVTIPPGPWEGEWNHTDDSRVSERNKANFKIELENVVRSLKNHPSIIQWIVFNENWGQFSTMENTQKVLDMDPNRLVTAASGFTDFEIGHIQDYHSYPYPTIGTWYPGVPTVDYPTTRRIRVVGEYGGIEYNVPGHTWYPNPSGVYDRPATSVEQLTMRFTNIAEWANAMAKQDGLSAAIYTEIADVENETNGLVTYDRKYDKINIGRIRPIIEYTIKSCSTADDFTTLVSPNAKWKYTLNTPSDGWQGMDFSDSSWKEDYGCFGDSGGKLFTSLRRTLWNTPDIWMRKVFNPGELTDEQIRHLFAELYVDGEVRVYINGVEALAFEEENWPLEKKHFYTLSDEAKKAICPNTDNVVAVHCHNAVGGCYIGLGLSVSNNIFGTGIGEVSGGKNQSLFEVYPNPVLDYVNIAFPAPLQNDEVVEFYSLTGIMTGRELIKAGTSHVSFSKSDFNLQPGTYIVKLKSASKILIVNG